MSKSLETNEIPPPFPPWMARGVPLLESVHGNGLYLAFYERRRRRGAVRYWTRVALQSASLVWWPVFLALMYMQLNLLIGSQIAILLSPLVILAVVVIRFFAPVSEGKLPLYIADCFSPRPRSNELIPLRQIPVNEREWGEALMLERIERHWVGWFGLLWFIQVFCIGLALFAGQRLSIGDVVFCMGLIVMSVMWSRTVALYLAEVLVRTLSIEVTAVQTGKPSRQKRRLIKEDFKKAMNAGGVAMSVMFLFPAAYILLYLVLTIVFVSILRSLHLKLPAAEIAIGVVGLLLGGVGFLGKVFEGRIIKALHNRAETASVKTTLFIEMLLDQEAGEP